MKEIIKLIDILERSIKDDPNNLITWGDIIKENYDGKVDEFRNVINNSKDWLLNYQVELQKVTNISNLKIKFTNVLWYFIEVSKLHLAKIPEDFTHKQTLINVSRFTTSELVDFQEKLVTWESLLFEREYELFLKIREDILLSFNEIKKVSKKVAWIDFQTSLSKVAYKNNYSKPDITKDYWLTIVWWRHPVIEQNTDDFIHNNLSLSKIDYVHVITWPNMWWKSTFLRQNALIILLAHIWSYVPCIKSTIPITDKIFSRIWAQDNLYLWQSTFMVEMQEVANILNNSTKSSFVIIDEVWRWTSTYDWMSLAWAILKTNHDKIKAKTLFATHYHELVDKAWMLKWVSNYSVAVWENDDNLIFLRKIIPWSIKKSYWIDVAKIAGLWDNVIGIAREMLLELEQEHWKWKINQLSLLDSGIKMTKVKKKENIIEKELKLINLDELSPISALNKLHELKLKIGDK